MQKGKKLKDRDLKNTSGGYIVKREREMRISLPDWDCIHPPTKTEYQVIDSEGNFVGSATESLSEAENIAVNNKLSTEIISEFGLAGLKSKKREPFWKLTQTDSIPPQF